MAEELKACPLPFCGGPVQFHKDDDCAGCHLIECQSCKTLFDLATKADPYNQAGSVEELQRGIAYLWNLPSQLPSQGGEAVSVISIPDPSDCYGFGYVDGTCIQSLRGARNHLEEILDRLPSEPLMTVAQHHRIMAAATHPADQVADDLTMVKVSRELLQDLRDLAFDQVEHHRAAMGAYKQTRQSAMDSVLAQADALLRS